MLYWICPECGHECSPAIRECPTCAAAEKAAPPEHANTGILSLAQKFESRQEASTTNGNSAAVSTAVIADEDTVELVLSPEDRAEITSLVRSAKPEEPAASTELAPLNGFALKPRRPVALEPVQPVVAPKTVRETAPALVSATITPTDLWLKPAGLTPAGDIQFRPARGHLPQAHEQPVEPAPSRRRSVAFLRGALPGVAPNELARADLAPGGNVRFTPVSPAAGSEEASVSALSPKAGGIAFVSSKLELTGQSLSEILRALELSAEELERSAIRAIQASFEETPTALLLPEAKEIVTAPAPPSEQWMRSPKLVFTAKEPATFGLATISAGPQTPTLAGPCLPPHLRDLAEKGASRRLPHKRGPAPTWMVSVLVAIVVFIGLGSLFQYLTANRDAKAASVAAASTQPAEAASVSALPIAREHPGARFVEVAGVRVVTAANKKPQLQYVVINHSAGELTGLNIHVAVHSADSPTGAPLFTVSSVIPALAANQSKEIRTDLDAAIKPASIPDWQSLRTEILIVRQ
jgi:hypothetical protein